MAKYLFEVSWEVCNKVGGIYTVLSSKARHAVAEFGENYYVVGPLLDRNPGFRDEPFEGAGDAIAKLRERGISVRAGRWDVEGSPRCLLVGFHGVVRDQDKVLYQLWEDYGVDSMSGQWDYLEPVLFSTVCGMAIESLASQFGESADVYAHFHEWMTGAGLLYLRKYAPNVSSVFTTHATILGRSISGSGVDLYRVLDEIEPAQEAKRHNVGAKFSMESVSARQADCFTAVSNVTSKEALALLGVNPTVVTPNAFDVDGIPDYAKDANAFKQRRHFMLDFASRLLKKDLPPEKTIVMSISGRYEYQNKGIDLFLDSLHQLDEYLRGRHSEGTNVVAFFLVLGGYVGVHEEALRRLQRQPGGSDGEPVISTHVLSDRFNDPITNACRRLQLVNGPENRCNVIFIPAYLDGKDGALNIPYYDALAGCDLGVYPSKYEPWGYTPLESIAYSVPAATTDLAGFGMWIQEHFDSKPGVKMISRQDASYEQATAQLTEWFKEVLGWDESTWREWKAGARSIAGEINWTGFYKLYIEAYRKARLAKEDRISGMRKQEEATSQTYIAPTNSAQPRMRSFAVVSELPEELQELQPLAYSMWWVWDPPTRELYRRLDPVMWEEVNSNPVSFLQHVDDTRIKDALGNRSYMQLYRSVVERFKATTGDTDCRVEGIKNLTPEHPVAYFSMEFGIHECMPIYSGGLGILSGDHLKTASDLRLPLLGVGLLYKFGYFEQRITRDGEQVPVYLENNFAEMPIRPVDGKGGKLLKVSVEMPGRTVAAQVWLAHIGSVPLYLLDTDVEENSPKDRLLTSKLYDSSTRERIEQEVVLGIGGMRAIRALAIEPAVYHLNEGHSAFLLIEQLRVLMTEQGLDFDSAREVVRARSVFTTHTPVPAGNERHNKSLIENYLRPFIDQAQFSWEQFWNLGHVYSGEDTDFEMTVLALKMCSRYNGVSRLHGKVARNMWQQVWRGFLDEEVPIGHITNGIHFGTWISDPIRSVLETYAGVPLEQALLEPKYWGRIDDIPDNVLWETHNALKNSMFEVVRQSLLSQWTREGEDPTLLEQLRVRLNPSALTIVFARRIATYKRPLLLLKDLNRLAALVKHQTYPIQIIFAGKAHPADKQAAGLIKEIVHISKEPDFVGRVVFVEGYNIRLARALVSGADLWLNNPVRPMEASGTSGMKASINGVVNCSILDGWFDECYEEDENSGWAIGKGIVMENREGQDQLDSGRLYDIIEERVIPAFYTRNVRNVPEQWTQRMKGAMRTCLRMFTTHRMLQDYATKMYEPAAKHTAMLSKSDYAKARALGEWKKKLPVRFSSLDLREVRLEGLEGNVLNVNEVLRVTALVMPGRMRPGEILLEIVIEDREGNITTSPLKHTKNNGSLLVFEGDFVPPRTGQFKYGIRALPIHHDTVTKFSAGLVSWG